VPSASRHCHGVRLGAPGADRAREGPGTLAVSCPAVFGDDGETDRIVWVAHGRAPGASGASACTQRGDRENWPLQEASRGSRSAVAPRLRRVDMSGRRVAAAFHGCRSQTGSDRAPADARCSIREHFRRRCRVVVRIESRRTTPGGGALRAERASRGGRRSSSARRSGHPARAQCRSRGSRPRHRSVRPR
jgi:hypothetical protein